MTVYEALCNALNHFGDPLEPGLYTGGKKRYYTYNFDLIPADFAGNRPVCWRALVQVHFFAPLDFDSVRRRWETIEALSGAGFTWPEVVDASEKEIQHYVFECEYLTNDERMEEP